MILLPRRAFFLLCALIVAATAFLLLAVAAQHGRGPLARFARLHRGFGRSDAASALCPALGGRPEGAAGGGGEEQGTIDAYLRIEAALTKGSLSEVAENAARLAAAFGEVNPDIAASARRLGRVRDLTAARREFRRLTALFSRQPADPGDEEDEDDDQPAARSLEV